MERFKRYYNDLTHTGNLTVTKLDTVNDIISGTFSSDLISEDGKNVVHITEGRFDYRF